MRKNMGAIDAIVFYDFLSIINIQIKHIVNMNLRYSVQEMQLSKIFNYRSPKINNRVNLIQSEFDDQGISQSPVSYLSNKQLIVQSRIDNQIEENLRKERIKSKMKSQMRQRIKMMSSRQGKSQLTQRKSKDNVSFLQKSNLLVKVNHSDILNMKQFLNPVQMIKSDCIVPVKLHGKSFTRAVNKVRIRVVNSVLENRRYEHYRKIQFSTKRSSPILHISQKLKDRLQPWRMNEQYGTQEPFPKKFGYK